MDCNLDMFSSLFSRDYFPTQNWLKMESSRSSVVVSPRRQFKSCRE
jgi:hypothetical protein